MLRFIGFIELVGALGAGWGATTYGIAWLGDRTGLNLFLASANGILAAALAYGGGALFAGQRRGLRTSAALQVLQLPVIHTSLATLSLYTPAQLFVGYSSDGSTWLELGGAIEVAIGRPPAVTALGVNVVALWFLVGIVRAGRRTPASVPEPRAT